MAYRKHVSPGPTAAPGAAAAVAAAGVPTELVEVKAAMREAAAVFTRVKSEKMTAETPGLGDGVLHGVPKEIADKAVKQRERERANRASAAASRNKVMRYQSELETRLNRVEAERNSLRAEATVGAAAIVDLSVARAYLLALRRHAPDVVATAIGLENVDALLNGKPPPGATLAGPTAVAGPGQMMVQGPQPVGPGGNTGGVVGVPTQAVASHAPTPTMHMPATAAAVTGSTAAAIEAPQPAGVVMNSAAAVGTMVGGSAPGSGVPSTTPAPAQAPAEPAADTGVDEAALPGSAPLTGEAKPDQDGISLANEEAMKAAAAVMNEAAPTAAGVEQSAAEAVDAVVSTPGVAPGMLGGATDGMPPAKKVRRV